MGFRFADVVFTREAAVRPGFQCGLFSKRVNASGAFAGLVVGFIAGMFKLTVQTLAEAGTITDGLFADIGNDHGYYACGWLTLLSAIVVGAYFCFNFWLS